MDAPLHLQRLITSLDLASMCTEARKCRIGTLPTTSSDGGYTHAHTCRRQQQQRERKRPALFHVETPALWVSLRGGKKMNKLLRTRAVKRPLCRQCTHKSGPSARGKPLIPARYSPFSCLCWPSACCVHAHVLWGRGDTRCVDVKAFAIAT